MLLNLGSNAVMFTEDGDVTLRVRERWRRDHTIGLGFAVLDTGIGVGMDEATQAMLFRPFTQADASMARR